MAQTSGSGQVAGVLIISPSTLFAHWIDHDGRAKQSEIMVFCSLGSRPIASPLHINLDLASGGGTGSAITIPWLITTTPVPEPVESCVWLRHLRSASGRGPDLATGE
ncbi:MAG: hypothetical protein WCG34_02520 [Leptolinea sp.]